MQVQIQQRGVITIPKKVRDKFSLSEGQILSVEEEGAAIVLRPQAQIDARLLVDIRESLDDLKHGRYISFSSIPEFRRKMKAKYGDSAD